MLYLIQTGHNLPDVHDLKNVHCWSSLIDLLHCHDVLTSTCTCQPRSTKIWRCLEVFAFATCTSPITHLICPPKFCIAFVFHFSWVLKLSQEELKTMLMQNFGEQNEVHCHFQQCLNTLWKSPKGFLNVSDVDNCVQKPRQLPTMYCAVWLVDFWPITILVKCLTILIALFYVFWSRTAQTRAVTPLPVLVSFFTSRT